MKYVYVVTWVVADSGYDGVYNMGIFDNKEDAEEIKEMYKEKHGEYEGFYVNKYPLNYYQKDTWTREFIHRRERT